MKLTYFVTWEIYGLNMFIQTWHVIYMYLNIEVQSRLFCFLSFSVRWFLQHKLYFLNGNSIVFLFYFMVLQVCLLFYSCSSWILHQVYFCIYDFIIWLMLWNICLQCIVKYQRKYKIKLDWFIIESLSQKFLFVLRFIFVQIKKLFEIIFS